MAGIFVDVCSRSLGRRAVVLLALAAWLALSAGAPLPAGAMALVAAEDLPFGPAAAGAFADLTGDGRLVLALVGEERAAVFDRPNPGGPWLPVTEIGPLPAPATAVGGGDINGDGVPELAVGTGNAGSVYVFRWAGSRWALLAQTPYVWSPVVSVQAGSL
ncbi:MAG: VCBS repeat-containing protein, partial [Firmicutes bacterium]|nr:VCBS repeat-containing protein [Bacillota bacterium]